MAGGPISPFVSYPGASGNVYPGVHLGGTNSRPISGMKVVASLGADAHWYLAFRMPATLPSGTCRLALLMLVNAASGNARVNPTWASVAVSENPDTITLNAETVQTITPAAADTFIETKITLDADTPVGGEIIYIDVVFETASWTLAAISTWNAYILFE